LQGCKSFWTQGIIHRDIKLANILIHFPDNPEIGIMKKEDKDKFLKNVDLTKGNFTCQIADFGLST